MGRGNLVLAIAADVGITLIVIVSSLRIMRFEALVPGRTEPAD
jgi:hypothetical protein